MEDLDVVSSFDESWIQEFEKADKPYDTFTQEENSRIKVNILYVNKKNQLEKIRESTIDLSKPNTIKREELVKLIKGNDRCDKVKYKLISILIYNFSLSHDELKNFLKDDKKYDFMTCLRNIDDYGLSSSISCMCDVNTLYILFSEDDKKTEHNGNSNTTKRVRFNLASGKTRRRKI